MIIVALALVILPINAFLCGLAIGRKSAMNHDNSWRSTAKAWQEASDGWQWIAEERSRFMEKDRWMIEELLKIKGGQ